MAQPNPPQSFANHARIDPAFHFVTLPLAAAALIWAIIRLIRHPAPEAILILLLALALVFTAFKARTYALKVQDRLIRLEERLRLGTLAPEALRPRIAELTESQLIALRFASDAELPALASRALAEGLSSKQIKQAIKQWRGDYFRV